MPAGLILLARSPVSVSLSAQLLVPFIFSHLVLINTGCPIHLLSINHTFIGHLLSMSKGKSNGVSMCWCPKIWWTRATLEEPVKFQTCLFSPFYLTHRSLQIAGICDQQNDEQPGNAVGKILVGDQCGDPPSLVPLAAAVVGIIDSVNAVTNMHSIQIFTSKVAKKMPKRKKKFGRSQRWGGNRLGWEFQFLVLIPGTPIRSRFLILFLIPEILVRFFFWNSDFWKVKKLEFRFAKFGVPVICLRRNSLCLIVAILYWLQSMYNDLISMVHKLAAPLQYQRADLGGTTSCYLMALSMRVMLLACYPR